MQNQNNPINNPNPNNPPLQKPNFPNNNNNPNPNPNPNPNNSQQTSYKADQMRNIDYFMNNIITNIASNNTDNIPMNNINTIQKMIDQQNEPGNPGLSSYLPLNTSTNNPELNNVNNVANNFGKIVDTISNFNNKNITHNSNVMSTVGNLTGLLTNIYSEQDAGNGNGNNNGNKKENIEGGDKKDEGKIFLFYNFLFFNWNSLK